MEEGRNLWTRTDILRIEFCSEGLVKREYAHIPKARLAFTTGKETEERCRLQKNPVKPAFSEGNPGNGSSSNLSSGGFKRSSPLHINDLKFLLSSFNLPPVFCDRCHNLQGVSLSGT
jgi:hypothetical protein